MPKIPHSLTRQIAMRLLERLPAKAPNKEPPLRFTPMYQPRVWGGRRLEKVFGRHLPDSATWYGESWELCDRPDRQSVVMNGRYAGCTLNQLWAWHRLEVFGEELLHHPATHYPLLLKILDVGEPLSIQVHPSAEAAREHGAEPKTEFWYVAEADRSAHLYSGLRPGVRREEFERALLEGGCPELLNRFEVERDDYLFVPSGRVHALGSGMLVFEIQQNSDTTYRLHDWGRKGADGVPRELHVGKGLEAVDWNDTPVQPPGKSRDDGVIASCEHFEIGIRSVRYGRSTTLGSAGEHLVVMVVRGQMEISGEMALPGDCLLIPASFSAEQREVTCSSLLTAKWLEVRIPMEKAETSELSPSDAPGPNEAAAPVPLVKPSKMRRSGRLAVRTPEMTPGVEDARAGSEVVRLQAPRRSRKKGSLETGVEAVTVDSGSSTKPARTRSGRRTTPKETAEEVQVEMPTQPSPDDRYALILAGGSGKRFWPWSRDQLPKQLLPLFGGKCLLQLAVERLHGLIPPERILVLTSESQLGAVREALPELPEDNLIAEPCRRDTAAAIALGIGIIESRNPAAVVSVLPSDHLIGGDELFRADLEFAMTNAAEHGEIVVLGIPPSEPSTAYGYIQVGRPHTLNAGHLITLCHVTRFVEKPEIDRAASMLKEGGYLWNAGMFVLSAACFRRQADLCAPWMCQLLDQIRADQGQLSEAVRTAFEVAPQTSFDYAVMEKASGVLVLQARFDWNDLGTWASYIETLGRDQHGNSIHGSPPVILDSNQNAVISLTKQRVALLGLDYVVTVVTDDAILIADKSKMDQLKSLVDLLPETLR